MKSMLVGLGASAVLAVSAPALADTIVLQQSGSTQYLSFEQFALPGSGTYRFSLSTSLPVDFEGAVGYLRHWDIFVAPPPRPHDEYLEGNSDPIEEYSSGFFDRVDWEFVIPETQFTYFPASEFYEIFGVPEGTLLYEEVRSENPYMRFWANFGEETFDYEFTLTRISAVPEPATWAMMIIGFGAVGSMVRASRRRDALSAA